MNFEFKASDVNKHSAAHVLAAAVKRIYPKLQIGIGPVTKSGFYYDFEVDKPITEKLIPLIEKNINTILSEDLAFQQIVYNRADAINLLLQLGQIYKAELLQTIDHPQVSFYKLGDEFIDLCRGPHVKSTGQVGIIKLTGIEQTHWNNDPVRPVMYRISGVVFQNIVEYNEYLESIRLSHSRDFNKASIKHNLILKNGEDRVLTERGTLLQKRIERLILNEYDDINYKEIESVKKESDFDIAYKMINRSYKALPITLMQESNNKADPLFKSIQFKTYVDFTNALNSISRSIEKALDINNYLTNSALSVEIKCGDIENSFVRAISNLLQNKIVSHNKILSSQVGTAIKLEIKTIDSVGNAWILFSMTIQTDGAETKFYSKDNTIESSINFQFEFNIEQIYKYLIEDRGLELPYKVSINQAICIPQSNSQNGYIESIANRLGKYGVNVYADLRSKSLKRKIRDAENNFYKFILVAGKKEEINNAVSVRHNKMQVGLISLDDLAEFINENQEK